MSQFQHSGYNNVNWYPQQVQSNSVLHSSQLHPSSKLRNQSLTMSGSGQQHYQHLNSSQQPQVCSPSSSSQEQAQSTKGSKKVAIFTRMRPRSQTGHVKQMF